MVKLWKEAAMLTRLMVTAVVAAAVFGVPSKGASTPASEVRASLVSFPKVTRVCGYYLIGQYIVVHDDARMARGEPCTTLYKIGRETSAGSAISFHCIPRQSGRVANTTLTTRFDSKSRVLELVEYQFAGDTEAHGVPAK
jgi:hypothetical protein